MVIGSLNSSKGDSVVGGTSILLQCLVDELRRRDDVTLRVIDVGSSRHKRGLSRDISRAMAFILNMAREVRHVDVVSLHAVSVKLWFTGTITLVLSWLAGTPVLIRKFAGTDYNDFPPWKRVITKSALGRCDMYLAETQHLVDVACKRDGITHCRWFPTHRTIGSAANRDAERMNCRRFVYVGQVREYKGIRILAEAAERLDASTIVDVYGPIFDDLPPALFDRHRRIFYKGILDYRDVVSTMREYDAFVLPTMARTEGYPGSIVEAYIAGLPVIATACGAIPEIVDETSGILVEPRNVESLYQAMKRLTDDSELYVRLCKGARERASQFSTQFWANKFIEYCHELRRETIKDSNTTNGL